MVAEFRMGLEFEIGAEVGLMVGSFDSDDALDIFDGEDLSCIFLNGVNFENVFGMFSMTRAYDGKLEIVD